VRISLRKKLFFKRADHPIKFTLPIAIGAAPPGTGRMRSSAGFHIHRSQNKKFVAREIKSIWSGAITVNDEKNHARDNRFFRADTTTDIAKNLAHSNNNLRQIAFFISPNPLTIL